MRRSILMPLLLVAWLTPPPSVAESGDLATVKRAFVADYANLAYLSYQDAVGGARTLRDAVDAFLAEPRADTLDRARQAWIDSRVPYMQTEAFRFYDGPIEAVEGRLNSWPIDENLIDYVEDDRNAGIVNHPERYPAVTTALVSSLNEKGGEKNITTGFHAIEFLLWGQDLSDTGPGERPYHDYLDGGAPHADRRRAYLHVVTHLLVDDLQTVLDEWTPDRPSNYRARFIAMVPNEALTDIMKGLGILSGSELAGERLTVPYETKDQEDEHSCFSDNTHRDLVFDVVGIQNVFRGRYTRRGGDEARGRGLRDVLDAVNPVLGDRLDREIEASLAAARAIPAPFDRAILGTNEAPGRVAVKKLIGALRAQANSIAEAGAVLGLRLNF